MGGPEVIDALAGVFGGEAVYGFQFEDQGVFYEDVGVVFAGVGSFVMDLEGDLRFSRDVSQG